jgi:hypothetical protein
MALSKPSLPGMEHPCNKLSLKEVMKTLNGSLTQLQAMSIFYHCCFALQRKYKNQYIPINDGTVFLHIDGTVSFSKLSTIEPPNRDLEKQMLHSLGALMKASLYYGGPRTLSKSMENIIDWLDRDEEVDSGTVDTSCPIYVTKPTTYFNPGLPSLDKPSNFDDMIRICESYSGIADAFEYQRCIRDLVQQVKRAKEKPSTYVFDLLREKQWIAMTDEERQRLSKIKKSSPAMSTSNYECCKKKPPAKPPKKRKDIFSCIQSHCNTMVSSA